MNLKNGEITERELALILNIQEETVLFLAETKQLPYVRHNDGKMYFDFYQVLKYLEGLC